jgi:hypothetical protein
MNREEAETHFRVYRESLRRELMRLAAYSRVYQRLFERKVDRLAELELASAFFVTTADALFFGIINAVDKLFDKKGKRGIFNFLMFAEHHPELFDPKELKRRGNYPDEHFSLRDIETITFQNIEADRQRIAGFKPLANFKLWRDKYQAHFDKKYFFDIAKLQKDAPLDAPAVEQAVKLGEEILNRYSIAFDGLHDTIEPVNAADIDRLLDLLHECLETESKNLVGG